MGYREAVQSGIVQERLVIGREILQECTLCPRQCGVNRMKGEQGFCRTGTEAMVASFGPHFGEESCLVGTNGSGTIFFCGCNLMCSFCQNYQLSRATDNDCREVSADELAAIMMHLQEAGCHNINLVTPTHVTVQILAALPLAVEMGLHLPLIYNCGGYETVETLQLLEGIIDIYMPDAKFWRRESAKTYLQAADYPERLTTALIEMQRQVGDLKINEAGLAETGLLVRHLLMPGCEEEATEIFTFLARTISRNCFINRAFCKKNITTHMWSNYDLTY